MRGRLGTGGAKEWAEEGARGEPMRTLSWYLTGCGMETGDADNNT